jgi:hypothetical protein
MTMSNEQLNLLPRVETEDEKFKNSASLLIDVATVPPVATLSLLQDVRGDATSAKPVMPNITIPLIRTKPTGEIRVNASCKFANAAPNRTSLSSIDPEVNNI